MLNEEVAWATRAKSFTPVGLASARKLESLKVKR